MLKKTLPLIIVTVLLFTLLFASGTDVAQAGNAKLTQGEERIPTFSTPSSETSSKGLSLMISPSSAPQELAYAMGIKASDLVSASLNGSDPLGVGIGSAPLGSSFPTEGGTFAILSTGLAESADDLNSSSSLSYQLTGLNNSQGNDLTQLALKLQVPSNMNCASLDFAYYSEEFPEFVGSVFNDAFTAEIGGTNFYIVNNQVVAPLNFAFDTQGNIISVNTVFGVTENTGTTYDGGTTLLRATTPVTPGSVIDIVFSVQDLGDSIYDSAVFLDKFFWSYDLNCGGSAQQDSDGDGLLDIWETQGLTVSVDGADLFVDLPAMGADPLKKDVFIEIDYMVDEGVCVPDQGCTGGHSHKPKNEAIDLVVQAYLNAPVSNPDGSTGINLHVDYGPDSEMNPVTHATWGSLSQSNSLKHDDEFGLIFDWNKTKKDNFSKAREAIFHYCIFIHDIKWAGGTSGISRWSPSSDFLVSLGSWSNNVGTKNQQAGTFMHELGHNLGLRHGGGDNTQYKPNYLSIMNYSFQTSGLRIDNKSGNFDYSRFTLPTLNEDSLNETIGLNGGTAVDNYGTRYFCPNGNDVPVYQVNGPIDWNCDGDATDTNVKANINNDTFLDTGVIPLYTNLNSYNDWANLVFTGGAIGQPGADPELPTETKVGELTIEENSQVSLPYDVAVLTSGDSIAPPGAVVQQTITIENLGSATDNYSVVADSSLGWADLGSVPTVISLGAGQNMQIPINVHIPITANLFQTEELAISVYSQTNSLLSDNVAAYTTVLGPKVLDINTIDAGPINKETVDFVVTFLTQVTGVDVGDFSLATEGITGAYISSVNGSGATYTVTVNTGSGNGTIRLDVIDNNSITSLGSDPLGGALIGDGDFTFGDHYSIIKDPTFGDVPTSHPYWRYIEILYANGLTNGCSTTSLKYCPDSIMNRAQVAKFFMTVEFGGSYLPPANTPLVFMDNWKINPWAKLWANDMYAKGLTNGCSASPLRYCPDKQVIREQVAKFGLAIKYGNDYTPPPATGTVFADLTDVNYWATAWAEQAYEEGLIFSCGTDNASGKPLFCPYDKVDRGFSAYVIVTATGVLFP